MFYGFITFKLPRFHNLTSLRKSSDFSKLVLCGIGNTIPQINIINDVKLYWIWIKDDNFLLNWTYSTFSALFLENYVVKQLNQYEKGLKVMLIFGFFCLFLSTHVINNRFIFKTIFFWSWKIIIISQNLSQLFLKLGFCS